MYAYARFEYDDGTGSKYAFITWIGSSIPPLKKAKVSTDKAFVKEIMPVRLYATVKKLKLGI